MTPGSRYFIKGGLPIRKVMAFKKSHLFAMYLPGIFLIPQNHESELLELFLYNPQ